MKLKILDLFCCSGGATEGALRIGAHVTGVDIRRPLSYPGHKFIQKDIREISPVFLSNYDFIMSSPPCHEFSRSTIQARRGGKKYPNFIELTRQLIISSGKPGYIENVPPPPITNHLTLCGSMFGIKVIRHRKFELINWHTFFVSHSCTELCRTGNFTPMCGKQYVRTHVVTSSMGLSQLRRNEWELNQAIPPAYSEFIINRWLNVLTVEKIKLQKLILTNHGH